MKNSIKFLIIISLGVMLGVFINTSSCSANTLDSTNEVPVIGRILSNDGNSLDKNDVQGNFPIDNSSNKDNNLINLPKTGDKSISIYFIVLTLAILMLIFNIKKRVELK